MLREEQDRAFRDSARRDRERIKARMEEEEGMKRMEEVKRMERERVMREKEERVRLEGVRMEWRRWARRAIVLTESTIGEKEKGSIRIAVRLPGGNGRSIRLFSPEATLTTLYAYVDSHFIPNQFPPADDLDIPPTPTRTSTSAASVPETIIEQEIQSSTGSGVDTEDISGQWWGFKLVLTYPRRELRWQAKTRLGDVDVLKGGATVVVEKIKTGGSGSNGSRAGAGATEEEEDGYDTESD